GERAGPGPREGVADRRGGAGGVDDRQDRSDRQPSGRAGIHRRRRVRRVHRQPQADGEPTMKKMLLTLSLVLAAASAPRLVASDPGSGDWPMWGGTPDRNMVSTMKGLPLEWDIKTKKNVKWVAELGSQSYGNIVVSGGVVLIGTNNESVRDPKQPG